jgi:uncharacterized protein
MRISFDQAKRDRVLADRQLDLADAERLFAEFHLTRADHRHSDTEERFISVGLIGEQVVIVVWTERNDSRRVITMWKANDRERDAYRRQRDRAGDQA